MQLYIRHATLYRYAEPVTYSIQSLRLTPRRDAGQRALHWNVASPGRRVEQLDAHGNITHILTLETPHRAIEIVVDGVVETAPEQDGCIVEPGTLSPLAYLAPTPLTGADAPIAELAGALGPLPVGSGAGAWRLVDAVREAVRYRPGSTEVDYTAGEAVARGEGVCQDQAHVFIAACRAAGVPARYVSGYLHTGDGGEAASHAWAEIWLGSERGWLSCDVTHRTVAGERHCRLAVGRDYMDAAPVRGVRRGGGREQLEVAVSVATSRQQ